jgi:hypothetical protein
MKWLLLGVLIFIVATRRRLVGDLIDSVRKTPEKYREGKKAADDPAAAAKPVRADEDDENDENDENEEPRGSA